MNSSICPAKEEIRDIFNYNTPDASWDVLKYVYTNTNVSVRMNKNLFYSRYLTFLTASRHQARNLSQ